MPRYWSEAERDWFVSEMQREADDAREVAEIERADMSWLDDAYEPSIVSRGLRSDWYGQINGENPADDPPNVVWP